MVANTALKPHFKGMSQMDNCPEMNSVLLPDDFGANLWSMK